MDKEEQQEDSVDTVTKAFGTMTTGSTAPATKNAFSMDFAFPYIMYDDEAKNHKVVTADFLVVGVNERFLCPKVNQDSTELHVQVAVPMFSPKDDCHIIAEQEMTHRTHKLMVFRDAAHAILKKHGDGSEEE